MPSDASVDPRSARAPPPTFASSSSLAPPPQTKTNPQAEVAYGRAVDLDERAAPAWQGLAQLHERTASWRKAAEALQAIVAATRRLAANAPDDADEDGPASASSAAAAAAPAAGAAAAAEQLQRQQARQRLPALLRRLADAHARAGDLDDAEAALLELLSDCGGPPGAAGAAAAAQAAEDEDEDAAAAAAAAAPGGPRQPSGRDDAKSCPGPDADGLLPAQRARLAALCALADVQLEADARALEARCAARVAAASGGPLGGAGVNVGYERAQEAGLAADGALAGDGGEGGGGSPPPARLAPPRGASASPAAPAATGAGQGAAAAAGGGGGGGGDRAVAALREIVATVPPTERHHRYHDELLRLLRRAVQVAPPGTRARFERRSAVLAACRAVMAGVTCRDGGARGGGCASPYAYETALRLLEVQEEVACGGGPAGASHQQHQLQGGGGGGGSGHFEGGGGDGAGGGGGPGGGHGGGRALARVVSLSDLPRGGGAALSRVPSAAPSGMATPMMPWSGAATPRGGGPFFGGGGGFGGAGASGLVSPRHSFASGAQLPVGSLMSRPSSFMDAAAWSLMASQRAGGGGGGGGGGAFAGGPGAAAGGPAGFGAAPAGPLYPQSSVPMYAQLQLRHQQQQQQQWCPTDPDAPRRLEVAAHLAALLAPGGAQPGAAAAQHHQQQQQPGGVFSVMPVPALVATAANALSGYYAQQLAASSGGGGGGGGGAGPAGHQYSSRRESLDGAGAVAGAAAQYPPARRPSDGWRGAPAPASGLASPTRFVAAPDAPRPRSHAPLLAVPSSPPMLAAGGLARCMSGGGGGGLPLTCVAPPPMLAVPSAPATPMGAALTSGGSAHFGVIGGGGIGGGGGGGGPPLGSAFSTASLVQLGGACGFPGGRASSMSLASLGAATLCPPAGDRPGGAPPAAAAEAAAAGAGLGARPSLVADVTSIAQRLVHSFPWSAVGQAHLALALHRREAYLARTPAALGAPGDAAASSVRQACAWQPPPARQSLTGGGGGGGGGAPPPAHGGTADLNCSALARARSRDPRVRARRADGLARCLEAALRRGAASSAAMIGLAELRLEAGDPAGALDAAKTGIKHVFERSRAAQERMRHAALMLNLLAAQAMLALHVSGQSDDPGGGGGGGGGIAPAGRPPPLPPLCGSPPHPPDRLLPDAARIFARLSSRVSEGEVSFGELVGLAPVSIRQQAVRGLARCALARGDRGAAAHHYEGLVAKALMGRGAAEPWAFAEYGWLLFLDGSSEAARLHMEAALDALLRAGGGAGGGGGGGLAGRQEPSPEALAAADPAIAAAVVEYRYKLGRIYWAIGGPLRDGDGAAGSGPCALSCFVAAAATAAALAAGWADPASGGGAAPASAPAATAASPWQAPALEWTGHWHAQVARDPKRAMRCLQRALALDPGAAGAGEALCDLLRASGAPARLERRVVEDALARAGGAEAVSLGRGGPSCGCDDEGAAAAADAVGSWESGSGARRRLRIEGGFTPFGLCSSTLPDHGRLDAGGADAGSSQQNPGALWALVRLARLQLEGGAPDAAPSSSPSLGEEAGGPAAAASTLLRALRARPRDPALWEALGSAYQRLGRHSSALKAYTRAVELSDAAAASDALLALRRPPGAQAPPPSPWASPRPYSLVQAASLHYLQGSLAESAALYRRAAGLLLSLGGGGQGNGAAAPALLGAGEALLSSARLHARMGSLGAAAVELSQAAEAVRMCIGGAGGGAAAAGEEQEKEGHQRDGGSGGGGSGGGGGGRERQARQQQHHGFGGFAAHPTPGTTGGTGALTAHKLLGDVLVQHAAVPPLDAGRALWAARDRCGDASASPADAADAGQEAAADVVRAAVGALDAQLREVRAAGRAYAAALHMQPSAGERWGDLANACAHEALLLERARRQGQGQQRRARQQQQQQPDAATAADAATVSELRARAAALARGGLRLAPASGWLWARLGDAVAGAGGGAAGDDQRGDGGSDGGEGAGGGARKASALAAAEYAWSRALQLNPRDAPTWVRLARLYAAHGAQAQAARCLEQARAVEPTLPDAWEGMAAAARGRAAAGSASGAPASSVAADLEDALSAYEHAVGLGGGLESWAGFAAGALLLPSVGAAGADAERAARGGGGGSGGGALAASAVAGDAARFDAAAVLAAAFKAAEAEPMLAAAHAAVGLALEARGQPSAAVPAHRTSVAMLLLADASSSFEPLTHTGPPPACPYAAPAAREHRGAALDAARLNLARALSATGSAADAAEAAALFSGLLPPPPLAPASAVPAPSLCPPSVGSWLAYASALGTLGREADARRACEQALELASAEAAVAATMTTTTSNAAEAATAAALPPTVACAVADYAGAVASLLRSHLASGRREEAFGVLLQHGADLAGAGAPRAALAGWVALAAAAAAAGDAPMEAQAREVAAQLAYDPDAGRSGLDPQARCWAAAQLRAIDAASAGAGAAAAAGAGGTTAEAAAAAERALRSAAAAVHLCPGDASLSVDLAAHALRAAPRYAAPAHRACPAPEGSEAGASAAAQAAAALDAAAVRVPALLLTAPAATVLPARAESLRLLRLVRASPAAALPRYLLALALLQRAAGTGQAAHHRRALAAARAAGGHVDRLLREEARDEGGGLQEHDEPLARLGPAALRGVRVRLLCAESEGELGGRSAQGLARARAAAEAALALAAEASAPATAPPWHPPPHAVAHRALARVLVAQENAAAAEAAYRRAAVAGDALAALELARLLAAVEPPGARAADASALLRGLWQQQPQPQPQPPLPLVEAAALHDALLLARAGDFDGARAAVLAAVAAGAAATSAGAPSAAAPDEAAPLPPVAAHAVQAEVALRAAAAQGLLPPPAGGVGGGGGNGSAAPPPPSANARHPLLLEARWAATCALRGAVGMPPGTALAAEGAGVAAGLLAVAESARGKPGAAAEALAAAASAWREARSAAPPELRAQAAAAVSAPEEARKAVHMDPTSASSWAQLNRTPTAA